MARLQSVEKILYVPTQPSTVSLIASHFKTTEEFTRIADPCCGKGEALAVFAERMDHKPQTWGVEISYSRAKLASQALDMVLHESFYDVRQPSRWQNHSISLLFNNPPYDWSHVEETSGVVKKHVRHEVLFIEWTKDKIVTGGHHVILIPRAILGDVNYLTTGKEERIARHLLGWYEDVSVWCDPENKEYQTFNQIIVLACNKRAKYQPPKKEEATQLAQYYKGEVEIPDIRTLDKTWIIPAAPESVKFEYVPKNEGDLLRLGKECSPVGSVEYERATYVRPLGAPFTPITPLNLGHITMLVSGKETGVVPLKDDNGKLFLMKGASIKHVDTKTKENTDEEGEYTSTKVNQKEKFISVISITSKDELKTITETKEVGDFITKYGSSIADRLLEKNKPLYDWKPTKEEWNQAGEAGMGLPPLKGRKERGPFPAQRHFGIAAYRALKANKSAIMNAEMGFGKTLTAQIAMDLLGKWPVLVVCPGHMVYKWRRDIERSSPPNRPVTARVITRPSLNEAPAWLSIKAKIEECGGTVIETYRRQVNPEMTNDPGTRRIVVIGFETVQAQSDLIKFISTLALRESRARKDKSRKPLKTMSPEIMYEKRGMKVEYIDRDEYTILDFYNDYHSGRIGERSVAIVGFDAAKYDAGYQTEYAAKAYSRKFYDEEYGDEVIAKVPTCPGCGKIIFVADKPVTCDKCKTPLREFSRFRRFGLARFVQKKLNGFFKLYISDEVHKTKGGDTDIGVMDQRLISSIEYNLALTGTLFGGNASSLFYLLYRRSSEIRRRYTFGDRNRWIDHYGIWEKQWSQRSQYVTGRGSYTNVKRIGYRETERPGISPGVIQFLLPYTVFGNITDLGYELPPMVEEIETLQMTDEMQQQYDTITGSLLSKALEVAKSDGDPGGLSVWFNTARYRPASSFREEVAKYTGKKGGTFHFRFPAVVKEGEWLPKEKRLAEIVYQNSQLGRKTLCFVEQTGTRDIRSRLKHAIETLAPDSFLRLVEVGVLSANDMSPARREAWITKKAPNMDAMLVNPKLVETGLDLVMFSDLIFYETTTSLYTLWQAMRRVWRLGQTKDVNVTFLSYADTLEQEVLNRMGTKMKYAMLLYGKEASGILVDDTGEDDIQRQIIQDALEGKTYRTVGEAIKNIFSTGGEKIVRAQIVEEAPGSIVATNPIVTVTDLPSGETVQLTLFPGITAVTPINQKRVKKPKNFGQQTSMWSGG